MEKYNKWLQESNPGPPALAVALHTIGPPYSDRSDIVAVAHQMNAEMEPLCQGGHVLK